LLERLDPGQPGGREQVAREVLDLSFQLTDPLRRETVVREIAAVCGLDRNLLRRRGSVVSPPAVSAAAGSTRGPVKALVRCQFVAVAGLVDDPGRWPVVRRLAAEGCLAHAGAAALLELAEGLGQDGTRAPDATEWLEAAGQRSPELATALERTLIPPDRIDHKQSEFLRLVRGSEVRDQIADRAVLEARLDRGLERPVERLALAMARKREGDLEGTEPASFEAFALLREARRTHISDPTDPATQRQAFELALDAYQADTSYVTALWWAVGFASWRRTELPETVLDSLIQALDERAGRLPEGYRHVYLSDRAASVENDLEEAYEHIRRATEIDPGFGVAANNRMFLALETNRPRDVLETANALPFIESDEVRSWWPWWWRICDAHHRLGEHEEELRVAQEARRQFSGNVHVAVLEARALAALGQVDELQRFLNSQQAIAPDLWALGWGYLAHEAGKELQAHGFHDPAREMLRGAAEWFGARANEGDNPLEYQWRRAEALYDAGQRQPARAVFDSIAGERPDNLQIAGNQETGALHAYRALLGIHLEGADPSEAVAWLTANPAESRPGYHTWQQARIAAAMGNGEDAVTLLQHAYRKGFSVFGPSHSDRDLLSLEGLPAYDEFVRPKG